MSDSLTATKVETNQCPLHRSILLTQGPIHEIFMKIYWELAELENEFFFSRQFWFFFFSHFFFASFQWKSVNIYRLARLGQNFDDYPGFQQIPGIPILLQQSVGKYVCNMYVYIFLSVNRSMLYGIFSFLPS